MKHASLTRLKLIPCTTYLMLKGEYCLSRTRFKN